MRFPCRIVAALAPAGAFAAAGVLTAAAATTTATAVLATPGWAGAATLAATHAATHAAKEAARSAAAASAKGSGPVDVLYAGSLVTFVQTSLDAAFHQATGYSVTGIPGGSTGLASEIKGGVHVADVFISAAAKSNAALEGAANGNWVTWYATFATSPLLIGYESSSKFATTLEKKPWWKVVTQPGFQMGRTNPATDPKGVLAVKAVDETATKEHDRALRTVVASTANIFPEQTMVGRLQAGQLDAGFFYGVEASAAKLPTVPLKSVNLSAGYTVTVVANAPHPAAAAAFVKFLLSAKGKALLEKNGMAALAKPKVSGKRAAVPSTLKKVLG